MNLTNDKYRRRTLADLLQRRGTATFDLLAEATQKLLLTSNNLIMMTTGEPRRKSVPPNEYRPIIIPGHHQCYHPSRPLAAVGSSNSGGPLGGPNPAGSYSGSNWLLTFADALDPSRDSTIAAVYRLLRAKDRIGESYKKIKGAFKKLQDEYVATKDDLNPILRYTSMKKMIKEIVALEKQYWILIDIPKQEPSESQMDYIVRILNCLDQRLQAASSTGAQQAKMTGIASLFAGSTQLSDRSKDALLLEQVKNDCHVVPFYNRNKHQGSIPTVFIPLKGQMINPSGRLDWNVRPIYTRIGVNIFCNGVLQNGDKENTGAAEKCAVHSVGYLSKDGWSSIDNGNNLFGLATENDVTGVKWFGDKQDQLQLTGKLIQLSLQCDNEKNNNLCIVFRIVGKSVNGINSESPQSSNEPSKGASTSGSGSNQMDRANQIGLIVGIACGIILTLTLIAVAVFWTVCWRQQKERLARKIQLHVLYQQRMQQQNGGPFPGIGGTARNFNPNHEEAVRSALEVLQSFGAANYNPFLESCWQRSPNVPYGVGQHRPPLLHDDPRCLPPSPNGSPHTRHYNGQQLPPPPPYPHQRRRLNFSPEYFERELMAHPPPSAEEFLFELRRMIEAAKGRIRSRRYAPRLEGIPEEDQWNDSYSTYNCDKSAAAVEPTAHQLTTTTTSTSSISHYDQVENDLSPVSSVDSGFADDSQAKVLSTTGHVPTKDQTTSRESSKVANWLMATTLPESIELTEVNEGQSAADRQNLKYKAQNPRKFENDGFFGRIFRRTVSEPGTSSEDGFRDHRANSLGGRPMAKNLLPAKDFAHSHNLKALDFAQSKIPGHAEQNLDAHNFHSDAHSHLTFDDQYWANHPIHELLLTCQALPYGCTAPRNRRGRPPCIFQDGNENHCFPTSHTQNNC